MRNRSQVLINLLAVGFLTALQAQHVVVVADARGVSIEAEISYEDQRRFHDDEVQPVFRVYEHGSDSVFVDVPTQVDGPASTFQVKKVRGHVPGRIESVGVVELVCFTESSFR